MAIDLRKLLLNRAAQGIGTGGGLLGNQTTGGLLGGLQNINPNLLIATDIIGSGMRGVDPFSSVLPAVAKTAQISKLLTPKLGTLKQAYDPKTESVVFATDKEIREKGLTPALPTKDIVQMPGGGLSISESYGSGGKTGNQKNIETANEIRNTSFAMNNVADNLITNLEKSKVGAVGATITALDSIGSQVKQAADSFGFAQNFKDTGSGAIDKVMTDNFKISTEAANYGKVKSAAINLAYLMARIDEPGGRFTDRDIALKMEELGLGANPQRTIEIMKNAIDLRNKNAKFQYKNLTGFDMPGFDIDQEEKKKKEQGDILDLGF